MSPRRILIKIEKALVMISIKTTSLKKYVVHKLTKKEKQTNDDRMSSYTNLLMECGVLRQFHGLF